MVDELFDRDYQSGRAALNVGIETGLRRLRASIAAPLKALHRIQFGAPWTGEAGREEAGCA